MPFIGVWVGFCGTIGGLAMAIHGFSANNYFGDWGVLEGVVLIVMSLVVFAAFRPKGR